MKLKFKRLAPEAVIPAYAKLGDAGLDLTATSINETKDYIEYGTGLSFEIPEGHVGLLFPRSSISNKSQMLANSVGVIDSNYRGEVKLRFKYASGQGFIYKVGERVGQLVVLPYPTIELEETAELSSTDREGRGFGSTGK